MREGRIGRTELVGVVAIVALAAVLRFLDLPTRGTWDADQGHDMLELWGLVREGRVPLLGPPTSIGDFHHGVLYYYLLAPAAFLSGVDPLAVVGFIALCGIAAVVVVWWLGRSVGGPVAGLVAAGLMAVSASAIEESTFIWNPNLIALSSAIAYAAAWHAWTSGQVRWWLFAGAGQAVTMHCHVLGVVLLVPLAALLVADARRRAGGAERRRVFDAGLGALGIVALSYVPLAMWELDTNYSETRAVVDYLIGGSDAAGVPLFARLAVVPLRILSWPLTGLITNQPLAGIAAAVAVVAILAWRVLRAEDQGERSAVRWFALTLGWSSLALAVGASSLASVVPGLPNDHYHAFLDPIVFVTVGLGVAALWRHRQQPVGRVAATGGVLALMALNVAIWPPRVAPDGGYPAAERAARRVAETIAEDRPFVVISLPRIKSPDAYGFPLTRIGRPPTQTTDALDEFAVVVACDRLLEPIIGAACGGPAEETLMEEVLPGSALIERFPASTRTEVSIYR